MAKVRKKQEKTNARRLFVCVHIIVRTEYLPYLCETEFPEKTRKKTKSHGKENSKA